MGSDRIGCSPFSTTRRWRVSMNVSRPMKKRESQVGLFPWRKPLVLQIADVLRHSLQRGQWQAYLPPERSLCELVQVSRPILRQALQLLQKEGLIRITHGQPTRILTPKRSQRRMASSGLVVLLLCRPLRSTGPSELLMIDELHRRLFERNCHLEIIHDLRLRWKDPRAVLQQILRRHEATSWILYSQPASVQRWFHQHRVRSVILGSPFPGVQLPSVGEDQRAVCRHAAGLFLGLGHRRIAYFRRQTGAAGDLAGEQGFREAFRSAPAEGATPMVVRHRGTVEHIRAHLRTLFAAPNCPTAILVSHVEDVLTLFTHLLWSGLRVPDNVSLIARQDDGFLARIVPPIARYELDPQKHARLLCQLLDVSSIASSSRRHIQIFPTFQRGESLAPAALPPSPEIRPGYA